MGIKLNKEQQKLVEDNLGLVHRLAKYYRDRNSEIDLDDLVQAGYEGLVHGARKYDCSKKIKFSTYAWWNIRSYIGRNICRYKAFPCRTTLLEDVNMVNNIYHKYRTTDISDEEIASHYSTLNANKVARAKDYIALHSVPILNDKEKDFYYGYSEEELDGYYNSGFEYSSLNENIYYLRKAIGKLSKIERAVIAAYYFQDKEMSLNDTAKLIQERGFKEKIVSRERIRQIKSKAINKIKESLEQQGIINLAS